VLVRSDLDAAISGEAWSLGGTLFATGGLLDEDGRPVSERRASSAARREAVFDMRPCPYRDERKGHLMNVSALAQITRHLDVVERDAAAFRHCLGPEPSWDAMLAAVVDLLARPAVFILTGDDPEARVPARAAVEHKLAAGYFGAMRKLLVLQAREGEVDPSVPAFMSHVRSTKSLVGASEACAGPTHLIERLCRTLLHGNDALAGSGAEARPERVTVSTILAQQIRVGVAWELFDARMERAILDVYAEGALEPQNPFMAREIEARGEVLNGIDVARLSQIETALPRLGSEASSRWLSRIVARCVEGRAADAALCSTVAALLRHHEGALTPRDEAVVAQLSSIVGNYVIAYAAFVDCLWALEQGIRRALGYERSAPFRLDPVTFPMPAALRWLEAVLGHRLRHDLVDCPGLALRSHRRTVPLDLAVVPGVGSDESLVPPPR
jgi:hypothetical protein